jgi:hypothetical protein
MKKRYSSTRFNYSRIRVLEKLLKMSSTRVLDTRRWNHYLVPSWVRVRTQQGFLHYFPGFMFQIIPPNTKTSKNEVLIYLGLFYLQKVPTIYYMSLVSSSFKIKSNFQNMFFLDSGISQIKKLLPHNF